MNYMKSGLINQNASSCGIYRAILDWDGTNAKIYIPGLFSNAIEKKELWYDALFSSYEMRNTAVIGESPCWVTFENGDMINPIIMGYFGKGIRSIGGSTTSSDGGGGDDSKLPKVPDETIKKLLECAYSKLGCAYVYGAKRTTSPDASTFDCSGFVYWCYGQVGITIGLNTYMQKDNGVDVDMNDLQPGDLIIWASSPTHGTAAHVVMVYNIDTVNPENSSIIHCGPPKSGTSCVNIRDLSWAKGRYYSNTEHYVRRIIQVDTSNLNSNQISEEIKKICSNNKNITSNTIVSYYFKNLKNNEIIASNNNSQLHAASLIKLFVLAKTLERVNAGSYTLSSINSDLKSMITQSDNAATNRLVQKIGNGNFNDGAKKVNEYANSLGCTNTVLRDKLGSPNSNRTLINKTSTGDCAIILEKIYNGTLVNKTYSDEALKLLKQQQRRNKIPAGVPAGVTVANKTGEINWADNDAAIIYTDKGDYILCVMIHEMSGGINSCNSTIKSISETFYNYVTK